MQLSQTFNSPSTYAILNNFRHKNYFFLPKHAKMSCTKITLIELDIKSLLIATVM